jgi:phage terminase small subunit
MKDDDKKKFIPKIVGGNKSGKKEKELTAKQEAFAQAIVFGVLVDETGKKKHLNASDCYRSVYNVGETTKPSSIWTEASKLLSNPKVKQRIDILKGQMETHALSSALTERDRIIERLWVMADNGQAEASQLRSLELLGKSIGLFSDRVEISETKNLDEVERELVEKLSALKQTVDKK